MGRRETRGAEGGPTLLWRRKPELILLSEEHKERQKYIYFQCASLRL